MPLALNPNQTVPYSLKHEEKLPDETRPVFLLRHLSCAQIIEVEQLLDNAVEEKETAKANEILNKVLAIGLAGWRQVELPFEPASFDKAFTPYEKAEMAFACVTAPRLSEQDLKKSASAPS